jgi:MFS transporter, DHA1 family, multidrug resistance protein
MTLNHHETSPENEIALAPVFPGDAADASMSVGDNIELEKEAAKHPWFVFAILCTLMGFASISTDLYLPAMPLMGRQLGASPGMVEWTISGYLIGLSLGQLFWGPLGDKIGRRRPVLMGIILFIIGSTGCALSTNIWMMIGWRMVQATGACANVVLSRAMVRDLYKGEEAAKMLSSLMTIMAIAPLLGPLVGGQILALAGWRFIFGLLVLVGVVTLFALKWLPETLPVENRNPESLLRSFIGYRELVAQPTIGAYAWSSGFFYAGVFAYIAGTPFAYIDYYHVPAQSYGFLFGLGILGIMTANTLNARWVGRRGSISILKLGTSLAALAGVILGVFAASNQGGLMGLAVPMLLFVSMTGFIIANSLAGAMANFPSRAGSVSALIGFVQYGSGIIGSALVGLWADGTPWPMAAVMAFSGVASFICARFLPSYRSES